MDYRQVTVHPESHIAPNATLVGRVEVAKDATILFNATLRGDYGSRIVIGEGSNVQENSCLHLDFNQDCIVGRGVTIGHGAVVHGCTLGDNVLVGMGAVVMNGAHVGANSLVAAGALVTEGTQVPEGSLVVGVPAKVRRQLTLEEIEGNREAARGYAAIGRDLAEQGILYWGADTVAMSVCEEVIAARHVGLRVLGISLVSNMACGVEGASPSDEEVHEVAQTREADFCRLLEGVLQAM